MLGHNIMDKLIVTNRKAFRDYAVIESLEAGIQLKGTEIKSIRAGGTSLADSFAKLEAAAAQALAVGTNPTPSPALPFRSVQILNHLGPIESPHPFSVLP